MRAAQQSTETTTRGEFAAAVRELLTTFFDGGKPFYGMSRNAQNLAFWAFVFLVFAVVFMA
jgi:hypothetical protein